MSVTRYSQDVDLQDLNSSHTLAVLTIPPGSRVLDLGAADGSVARALVKRGCSVWAIERDAEGAHAARSICARVVEGDLEEERTWSSLDGELFDAVLALDVLEHLQAPAAALRRAVDHLAADGLAIVSLPNITHGAVRLMLLEGRFEYGETGLLDRTHLRFFDRSAAERLMKDANLAIVERLRVRVPLDATEIPIEAGRAPEEVVQRLAGDPEASTYQFVFVGRHASSAVEGGGLPERLQNELDTVRTRFAELERYARHLEAEHARQIEVSNGQRAALDEANTAVGKARLDALTTQETHEARLAELTEQLNGPTGAAALQRAVESAQKELAEAKMERAALAEELSRRMEELHQKHLELRHSRADVAVKQAFIDTLKGERPPVQIRVESNAETEAELQALRVYTQSAGFRLVESVIAGLRKVPFVYGPARALVRALAGRSDTRR